MMQDISPAYLLAAALLLGAGSMLLRALPFIALKSKTQHPLVAYLAYWCPATILSILVAYSIRPALSDHSDISLPTVLSVLLVIALHHCYRKPLLSIFGGTLSYMILSNSL